MAPQVGLEPTTLRLTAGCSAIELLRSVYCGHVYCICLFQISSKADRSNFRESLIAPIPRTSDSGAKPRNRAVVKPPPAKPATIRRKSLIGPALGTNSAAKRRPPNLRTNLPRDL